MLLPLWILCWKHPPTNLFFPFPTPKVEFKVIPSMKVHKNPGKSNRLPSSATIKTNRNLWRCVLSIQTKYNHLNFLYQKVDRIFFSQTINNKPLPIRHHHFLSILFQLAIRGFSCYSSCFHLGSLSQLLGLGRWPLPMQHSILCFSSESLRLW